MAEFTPGPWEAKEWVCHAATTVMSGDTVVAECSGHGRPSTDSDADARLIATALEMYQALKFVKEWFQRLEDNTDKNDPLRAIRLRVHAPIHAAIDPVLAKAEGKSNG